jgi:hypothetical protein
VFTSEVSAEIRLLATRLTSVPVGTLIDYADMSAVTGRNIQTHRHIAYAAMRLVRAETGAVFVSVKGEGYKRLAAQEVPEVIGTAARARIRSNARRAKKTIVTGIACSNSLPADVQRRAAAEISVLGLLEHIARDKSVLPDANAPLSPETVAHTAKRFLSRIGAV